MFIWTKGLQFREGTTAIRTKKFKNRGRNSNAPSKCTAHTAIFIAYIPVIPIAVRVSRDIIFRLLIPWYSLSIKWIIISRKIGLEEQKVIIIINVRNLSWISNRTLFRFFWDAGLWSLADVLSSPKKFYYNSKSVLWTSTRKSVRPRWRTTNKNSVHRRQRTTWKSVVLGSDWGNDSELRWYKLFCGRVVPCLFWDTGMAWN